MRWITFFILLYLMGALQLANLGGVPHPKTSPWPIIQYLPILTLFYGLYAAEASAPFCGLICGLCYDLLMPDLIGTHAVPLALTGFIIMRLRLSIFREHFVSQLLISLLALLFYAFLETLMRLAVGAPLEGLGFWVHWGDESADAVYSAVFAPCFYWFFFRFHPLLGFTSHGPRGRIHESRR